MPSTPIIHKKDEAYKILRNKYPEQECVLLQEVSDSVGARSRSIDFMIINLWESRGLSISGIERKSHRGDWLNEMKNPKKQENHFQYCDYFYLLTDNENVAKLEEIPETWGWLHIKGARVYTMKKAPKLKPKDIPRPFLCAMLRRAQDKTGFVHHTSIQDKIDEAIERTKNSNERTNINTKRMYDELLEDVETFESLSGLDIHKSWNAAEISAEIIKYVKDHKLISIEDRVKNMKENIDRVSIEINNAYDELMQMQDKS